MADRWVLSFAVDGIGAAQYDASTETWTLNGEREGNMSPRLAEFIGDQLSEMGVGVTWTATPDEGADR